MEDDLDTGSDLDFEIPGAGEDDPQGAIGSALEDGADGLELDGTDDAGDSSKEKPKGKKEEKPSKTPAQGKPRTLAELNKLTESGGPFKMTKEERQRVQTAARFNLKTEEELDAKLAELAGQGKPSEKKSKEQSKSLPASKTPEGEPEGDPQEDEESDLIKHLPNVPKGDKEAAVRTLKAIRQRSDAYGALTNSLKEFGIEKPEEAVEAVRTLNAIDEEIAEKLRTPEGLRQLYEAYAPSGVQIPPFLTQGNPPAWGAAPAGAPAAPAAPATDLFKGMEDDAYLSVGEVKKALPQIIAAELAKAMPAAMGQHVQTLQKLAPVLNQVVAKSQRESALSSSLRDVSTSAQYLAQFKPEFQLKDKAEKIWAESVDAEGNLVDDPHPEWPKLQKLFEIRQRARKAKYPTTTAFLAERLLTTGGLHKVRRDAQVQERTNILKRQTAPLQPALNSGRRPPADNFKFPRTPEELERLKTSNPDHYQRAREMIRKGQVKVRG